MFVCFVLFLCWITSFRSPPTIYNVALWDVAQGDDSNPGKLDITRVTCHGIESLSSGSSGVLGNDVHQARREWGARRLLIEF